MSKVTLKVDLDFEELRKVISQLSDDEKESLFFLNLTQSGVRLCREWKKRLWRKFARVKEYPGKSKRPGLQTSHKTFYKVRLTYVKFEDLTPRGN